MDYDEVIELISQTALNSHEIMRAAAHLMERTSYIGKADLKDDSVAADIKAVATLTESIAIQMRALNIAADILPELSRLDDVWGDEKLVAGIESALEGESVFLYADGPLPQAARFAASVHHLAEETEPLSGGAYESVFFRGSLIGFLFRGNRDASARVARRAKDALVGKASAEMAHEEVRAYREFVEATQALPSAILITERYAFAKTARGVAAFHLDTTRKAVLRQEPGLALSADSFVKRMLDLPQPDDVELPKQL